MQSGEESNRQESPSGAPVARMAMHWLVRRMNRAEWNAEAEQEFRHWLEASPAHLKEFGRAESTLALMSEPSAYPCGEIDRILAARPASVSRRHSRRKWLVGLGAAATFVGAALVLWPKNATFSAGIAQGHQITLPDGTRAYLDGGTTLRYYADSSGRNVELLAGAVVLEVAEDIARPFQVRAEHWIVRDIGTTFQVHLREMLTSARDSGGLDLSVESGEVELRSTKYIGTAPVRLVAGEETSWEANTPLPTPKAAGAGAFAMWREGRMRYRDRPLTQVMADLQRHHQGKIIVEEKSLEGLTVTGTLNIADVMVALNALEQILPLRVDHGADGTVRIRARSGAVSPR